MQIKVPFNHHNKLNAMAIQAKESQPHRYQGVLYRITNWKAHEDGIVFDLEELEIQ